MHFEEYNDRQQCFCRSVKLKTLVSRAHTIIECPNMGRCQCQVIISTVQAHVSAAISTPQDGINRP